MTYVEGFLAAVPTANKEEYRQRAESALPIFKDLGATRMVECWGDDIADGKITDFKRAVKAEADETVVFSRIEYPDKATRDAANEKMMSDPRMAEMGYMPFDGKRMIFSGFTTILDKGSRSDMGYVDGYVIPVANEKKDEYRRVAEAAAPIFMEHGASQVVENWGDDVKRGKTTDFYGAVDAKKGENIVFSWITWPSKEARVTGNEAVMADERFKSGAPEGQPGSMPMPFDGKRMIMGGFVPILGLYVSADAGDELAIGG